MGGLAISRYRVHCRECEFAETTDDADPPSYADPAKNPWLRSNHEWDAWSAALGAHDNHEMDTGHDVEIINLETGESVGP